MSYSWWYQYGKSDELREKWGGWWCPLEDARSFTETILAAVAELRWDHTFCKNMLGAFETTTECLSLSFTITITIIITFTITITIVHYYYPRKSSSDDCCEQPDWGGDGSPGNGGLLLVHHRHNDVDDYHEEENVDEPGNQPGI